MRSRWITTLGFHLLIQLLGFSLFTPLATWLARRIVMASGEPVISNFDIAGFVLSPAGVVAAAGGTRVRAPRAARPAVSGARGCRVVHDGDLLRMGGDPRKVAQMTAAA